MTIQKIVDTFEYALTKGIECQKSSRSAHHGRFSRNPTSRFGIRCLRHCQLPCHELNGRVILERAVFERLSQALRRTRATLRALHCLMCSTHASIPLPRRGEPAGQARAVSPMPRPLGARRSDSASTTAPPARQAYQWTSWTAGRALRRYLGDAAVEVAREFCCPGSSYVQRRRVVERLADSFADAAAHFRRAGSRRPLSLGALFVLLQIAGMNLRRGTTIGSAAGSSLRPDAAHAKRFAGHTR
jgi:hypothetical protein